MSEYIDTSPEATHSRLMDKIRVGVGSVAFATMITEGLIGGLTGYDIKGLATQSLLGMAGIYQAGSPLARIKDHEYPFNQAVSE